MKPPRNVACQGQHGPLIHPPQSKMPPTKGVSAASAFHQMTEPSALHGHLANLHKSSSPSTTTRTLTSILLLFSIITCLHLAPYVSTTPPQAQPTSNGQSQAAIVRRLYYSSPSTSTSNRHSGASQNPHRASYPPSPPKSTPVLSSRGIAKVTPISLQSTFNIRLNTGSPPPPKPNATQLPISTVSASIPVVSAGSAVLDDTRVPSPSVNVPSVLPPMSSTTPTTTSTTTTRPSSSRQGKSLNDPGTPPPRSDPPPEDESNLCFLSHGGSSETFTVNEAMPVDSVIGTIKVIGNASTPGGNIELSIIGPSDSAGAIFTSKASTTFTSYGYSSGPEASSFARRVDSGNESTTITPEPEPTIPIRIDPGTKKLVLARKLDKESVEGESGITIGVRCRPKKARQLSRPKKNSLIDDEHQGENNLLDPDPESTSRKGKSAAVVQPGTDPDSSYWIYDTSSGTSSGSSPGTPDDDIIIPIRILVTDANDNRPIWQGPTPYTANISEMATVGSVVLSGIRAIDNDQLGPYSTVEYYIEPGPYSSYLRFASPLEGTLVLASPLDYETLPKFNVTIRAQDQGNPPNSATTTVEIRIQDADDQNPRFEMDKYTTVLADGQRPGDPLAIQPQQIRAEDPDRGIRSPIIYGFNSRDEELSRENSYFKIDATTGEVSLRRPLPASVQLPLTLVIRATQLDNRDRYALTTLTILSRRNQIMPELRFLHMNYSTSLLESTPPGHVVLTAQTSRITESPSNSASLRFQILDDDEGYFAVRSTGEILIKKSLDYEKHKLYSFRIMVTDGRQTDVARVTVSVLNVNEHDPIFAQTSYLFHVSESRLRSSPVIGQIRATDADDGDRVQISLSGPHAAAFALSATDGTLRLRSLRLVNTSECHMIATAVDSGTPPRSTSASVVVKFSPSLLKSFIGRTLNGESFFLTDWEDDDGSNDLDRSASSSSPSAADILHHGASSLFNASANSTALVLVIVLGVLLGTLFIIIVALTLHVLKNRKYESRSGSPGATASLHHPVTGSLVGSSAASTTSSGSSSSSSSSLSINAPGETHYHLPSDHAHHHHHVHHLRGHQHYQQKASAVAPPKLNGSRNSQLFFHGLRVGAKVSPSEINSSSSPDNYDDHDEYVHHQQQHHHDSADHQIPKFTRKTFMDAELDENTKSLHHHHHHHSNELDSAISSDLSTGSDIASGRHGGLEGGGGQKSEDSGNQESSNCSRSSSADLVRSNQKSPSTEAAAPPTATVGSRISVIKWPQGSIPRRVKKLTWQDEQRNNHLDQMYTSNSTVTANIPTIGLAAKTKTLSGHLLTGSAASTTAPPPSQLLSKASPTKTPPLVAPKPLGPGSKTFGQFMPRIENDSEPVNAHYHHHLYSHPHVPNHNNTSNPTTPTSSNLPDLTVYF